MICYRKCSRLTDIACDAFKRKVEFFVDVTAAADLVPTAQRNNVKENNGTRDKNDKRERKYNFEEGEGFS